MRLTRTQTLSILATVRHWAGNNAAVHLFGSRLNDQAKGGDVDLFIETVKPLMLLDQARIKMHLEADLCLPVDIVAKVRDDKGTPFQRIAQAQAVRLDGVH